MKNSTSSSSPLTSVVNQSAKGGGKNYNFRRVTPILVLCSVLLAIRGYNPKLRKLKNMLPKDFCFFWGGHYGLCPGIFACISLYEKAYSPLFIARRNFYNKSRRCLNLETFPNILFSKIQKVPHF